MRQYFRYNSALKYGAGERRTLGIVESCTYFRQAMSKASLEIFP